MRLKKLLQKLEPRERLVLYVGLALFVVSFSAYSTIRIREQSVIVPIAGGLYREGVVGQPRSINPVISNNVPDEILSAMIFSPLKDLVSNIDAKKDSRVYNIKIFENLKWSNGQPLTADDIVFTIKTIQDPRAGSPLYKNWEGVTAERISELQIQFILPSPYAFFEKSMMKLPVIPKHIFSNIPPENFKLSAYNLEPIGSGPYKIKNLVKRKDGFISQYSLSPNENYFKDKPFIENLKITFFETDDDMLRAFRFRQIDGFGTLSPIPENARITSAEILEFPMSRYYAVFANPSVNPSLKDETLRATLFNLIDKKSLSESVFGTSTYAVDTPVPADFKNINIQTRSPEEIQTAVNDLKKTYGRLSFSMIVPKIPFLEKTAEALKNQWIADGVDEINIVSLSLDDVLTTIIKSGNYELLLFGNVLDNPEDLYPFWHSSERFYPGLNLALYKNSKADSLMEKIRTTLDPQERAEDLKNLSAIIKNDNSALFLFSIPYTHVHRNRLGGLVKTDDILTEPSDIFQNIAGWYVAKARVIKK